MEARENHLCDIAYLRADARPGRSVSYENLIRKKNWISATSNASDIQVRSGSIITLSVEMFYWPCPETSNKGESRDYRPIKHTFIISLCFTPTDRVFHCTPISPVLPGFKGYCWSCGFSMLFCFFRRSLKVAFLVRTRDCKRGLVAVLIFQQVACLFARCPLIANVLVLPNFA